MFSSSNKINLISLFVFHGVNTATAAIAFPWALTVLSEETYARIVFSEAIIVLFIPLVVYGFDLTIVRTILRHRDEKARRCAISEVFPKVAVARGVLFIIASFTALSITALIRPDRLEMSMAWLLLLLAWSIQPTWYFQATQNHLPIAITTVLSRLFFGVVGFIVIPEASSAIAFPLFYGAAVASGALMAFGYVALRLRSKFWSAHSTDVFSLLREGFVVFLSGFSVSGYRGLGVIFLELFGVGAPVIAVYSIVEKITKAIQAACRPLNQYFLPKTVSFVTGDKVPTKKLFQQLSYFSIPQVLFLVLLWTLLSLGWFVGNLPQVIDLEPESQERLAEIGLAIMSCATFFGLLNFVFGATALNALGGETAFFRSVLIAGLVAALTLLVLIPPFGALGAFVAFFLGEFSLFIGVSASLLYRTKKDGGPSG